jgi:2'-5' RNA ligase
LNSLRLFAAISLSSEILNKLQAVLDQAASIPSGVRWVEPVNLHLTLKFFGEMPEEQLSLVTDLLAKTAARHAPFSLDMAGFDGFPNSRNPKVLFVPVRLGHEKVKALAEDMEKASGVFGFPSEKKPFNAHLTLGRVKTEKNLPEVWEKLTRLCHESFGNFEAGSFSLYQSRLTGEGPVYTQLREFTLTAPKL